ncbi:MAG: hypothetical protein NT013_07220 [Planctomycetia bacterium]|nr:hypothetical protein [Planctomycetia bacterium]
MSRIVLRSQVGLDGMLRIVVPIGSAEAERPMRVTIESIPTETAGSTGYTDWLDHIAGKWQGEFERLPGLTLADWQTPSN